jgi:predicted phage baseplate assembly protein
MTICPCDGETPAAPVNLPGLPQIAFRAGDYISFRQAVLTPLPAELTLSINGAPVWRTDGQGDLAVMIAEWFAYVADIISFYNERIANQVFLRTASLPESVNNLIALLGYRPRPAIGAVGTLAALLSPGQSFGNAPILLPQGLQFQSKPTPGQTPQIFELLAPTQIAAPDQIPAAPPPVLLGTVPEPPKWVFSPYHAEKYVGKFSTAPAKIISATANILLLQGAVKTIDAGALLRLRDRTGAAGPWLATVQSSAIGPSPSGAGQQTTLTLTLSAAPPATLAAAGAALESAAQSAPVWSFFKGAITGATIHLASLARQITPGDWLLLTAASGSPAPLLVQVKSTQDAVWDANAKAPGNPPFATISKTDKGTTTTTTPIPVPHTEITLTASLPTGWSNATVTVHFGWVTAGILLNQPFSPGTPTSLASTSAQNFPPSNGAKILLQDSTGLGIAVTGSSAGGAELALGSLPNPAPALQPPFLVLPTLLTVTRGKTVANEILGSGDPTNPAQDFKLTQSPVTYLAQGATYASTIQLTVNNLPWKEVPSFYGQAPGAEVFVTREDNSGKTHVMFGDGVNGARLPSGVNNIIATYRIGAGAASPPAGKLTIIAKSYPGLRAVLNPVAVSGGADADPANQIQRFAPRSVLTFGRAVSVFDYAALAAEAPGVTRAGAVWAWSDARQRTLVTVYVGDDAGAATAAATALRAASDPNRPVQVLQAAQIAVALTITVLVTPGMDTTLITAAITTALAGPQAGIFGSWTLGIGQTLFDSQIEAAVLSVTGAVAITSQIFYANGVIDPGPLHLPGEGAFFTLDPADINLTLEPANGG